jgi:hypothetical protein
MGKMTNLPESDSRLRILLIITLVLLILSSMWIFYDLYAYLEMRANPVPEEFPDYGLGIGLIIRILLYTSFAFMMFRAFRSGLKTSLLTAICTLTGVVAGISVVLDWAALVDIWHDYRGAGGCITEWTWLFISLAVQLAFSIAGLLLVYSLMKGKAGITSTVRPAINEGLYEMTQYVGIVCGLAGFAFTVYADVSLQDWRFGSWLVQLLLLYCLAIIMPYILIIVFWMMRLARKSESSLYDEKQRQDIACSGLTAWLASIPLMAVVFISDLPGSGSGTVLLWLHYYLFSTLFIFSLSLLLRFRKE